jgi:hypothetical protein
MPIRRVCSSLALLFGALSLLLVLIVPMASASEPASVTVRVQGFEGNTLLPQTTVETSTAPVPVEGGSCSGTSVGGALYDAVHGNWKAQETSEGVEILGIDGLDFPSFAENPGVYWALWLGEKYAEHGACVEEASSNSEVVFFPQCYEVAPDCTNANAPEHFLTATDPSARVVNVGEAVSLTVGSIGTASGKPEPSLPAGVLVTGGTESVSPGAGGVAKVSFAHVGTFTLQAQAPSSVPSTPYTICVHNGNDGTCGTNGPAGSSAASSTNVGTSVGSPYKGAYALVPKLVGLTEGRTYRRGHAPRLLSGSVLGHAIVTSVSLALRREYRGRCFAYDAVTARFVRARCGVEKPFKVSSTSQFSYLLPEALPPGRYVLDIEATDAAGNRTTAARGTSRIVFHVK